MPLTLSRNCPTEIMGYSIVFMFKVSSPIHFPWISMGVELATPFTLDTRDLRLPVNSDLFGCAVCVAPESQSR